MRRCPSSLISQAVDVGVASYISYFVSSDANNYYAGLANKNTIYDLASLTKILGTTLAVARAISDGYIFLDEEPFANWPQVSVKNLLAHTSGLAAHIKFYEHTGISPTNFSSNRRIIFKYLFEQQLSFAPNTLRLYSDLNFLALGWLLEERLRKPLIDIFTQAWNFFEISNNLRFFSSNTGQVNFDNIAPTGVCPKRGLRIRRQVHDLNCYYLGGLAGHAGLFGDLESLKAFGNFFLSCVKKPKNSYEELIAYFAHNSLGFDKPQAAGSVRSLSSLSFGHFGFTGTSLWLDPSAQIFWILLSNRVDARNIPEGIFWLRSRLHHIF